MGRKIPAKKHRTVKDPYEQQANRYDKIKHKVNRKPSKADDQELPKCIQNIAHFKKAGLEVRPKKKKNKYKVLDSSRFVNLEDDQPGMIRPLKLIPRLIQNSKESDEKFLLRVNAATKSMLKEAEYEDKFNVEVRRDEWGTVISTEKREKIDPLVKYDDEKSKKDLEQAERKKQKNRDREMKKKMKRKKIRNEDDKNDFAHLKDNIEFGEVVHEPPKLDTQRLTKKIQIDEKINSRGFLFMKTLKGENNSIDKDTGNGNKLKPSMSRQRQLEEERKRVVSAYRELKKNKKHKRPAPY